MPCRLPHHVGDLLHCDSTYSYNVRVLSHCRSHRTAYGTPTGLECMIRWRLSLERVLRTCSVECHAGYPTMWENFYIVGALALTMWEYSHIVGAIAQHMELPHAFQVFSFMRGLRTHVIQVFTFMGWLTMYGKSSHQSLKLYLLLCGCCCSTACSVLMAP